VATYCIDSLLLIVWQGSKVKCPLYNELTSGLNKLHEEYDRHSGRDRMKSLTVLFNIFIFCQVQILRAVLVWGSRVDIFIFCQVQSTVQCWSGCVAGSTCLSSARYRCAVLSGFVPGSTCLSLARYSLLCSAGQGVLKGRHIYLLSGTDVQCCQGLFQGRHIHLLPGTDVQCWRVCCRVDLFISARYRCAVLEGVLQGRHIYLLPGTDTQ
jgi:hypothetical protein